MTWTATTAAAIEARFTDPAACARRHTLNANAIIASKVPM